MQPSFSSQKRCEFNENCHFKQGIHLGFYCSLQAINVNIELQAVRSH